MKSDLIECEKFRQKRILHAEKSEYGWSTVIAFKEHDLADDSDEEKGIHSAERRTCAVMSSRKKELKSPPMAATKRSSPLPGLVLSSSSQSSQPGTANSGFLPLCPNLDTCFAFGKPEHWHACCPAMTKQFGFPTSK